MKKCPVGKIENPATGKCVNRDGIIGKAILAKKSPKKSPKKSSRKKCPAGKIENPATGKWNNRKSYIKKITDNKETYTCSNRTWYSFKVYKNCRRLFSE